MYVSTAVRISNLRSGYSFFPALAANCNTEFCFLKAILLQHTLRCIELPGVDHTAEVLQEIGKKIKEGQGKPKKGTKAQKVKRSYHSMPCAYIHYGRIFMCMITQVNKFLLKLCF